MSTSFLVDPLAFPARADGVGWGEEHARLTIAGIPIQLEGLSPAQRGTLDRLYPLAGGEPPRVQVTTFRVSPSAFRKIDPRGWSYSLDFDYGPEHTHLVGMDWIARLDYPDGRLTAGLWASTEEAGTFHGALENFLRVLAAHVLLFDGGVLLHSAAVVSNGGAHLFVGPSGAGKSTISHAARAAGRLVISDDLNVVTPGPAIGGSSFFSEIGTRSAGSHPLRGIYRLVKGTEDEIRPMSEGEALASLVACAPFVNHSRFLANRLWSNLAALVTKQRAHVLTFRRQATFWHLLEP